MSRAIVVGILNCTPDSFSDGYRGGRESFLDRASALLDDGAEMLDVGGDSTRPGSVCVSDDEEWKRIEPILSSFAHRVPLSVDTHKAVIAKRAIELGVTMINDVTGGVDQSMIEVVANSTVLYTYMFNAFGTAHSFETPHTFVTVDSVARVVSEWANRRAELFSSYGIALERQVMDTGFGGFLSPDPAVSRVVADTYWQIATPVRRRMVGCSRKGFLRQDGERTSDERDDMTARIGAQICCTAPADSTIYLRVHNVARQRSELRASRL